jgi:hypothetical protein
MKRLDVESSVAQTNYRTVVLQMRGSFSEVAVKFLPDMLLIRKVSDLTPETFPDKCLRISSV